MRAFDPHAPRFVVAALAMLLLAPGVLGTDAAARDATAASLPTTGPPPDAAAVAPATVGSATASASAGASSPTAAPHSAGAGKPGTPPDPTGPLALATALASALTASPELAPYAWEIRAEEARALQAGLRPNPSADLAVEDVLGGGQFRGGREAQLTLQLGQLVELGGKRAARRAAADRATELARADYDVKRAQVLADVTGKFLDVLERQHALALAAEMVELDRSTLGIVRERLRAGAGSALDEERANVTLAESRLAEDDARHELDVARVELAATWGGWRARFERATGDLFGRRPAPSWTALERRLAGAPEIARALGARGLRAAELRLARARGIPDATVAAGPRRFEGTDEHALVVGLSVPLPLFDRNQGGVAEAEARAAKASAEEHAVGVRLRALLFRQHQELVHAWHVLEMLERDVLPASERLLKLSRQGFAQGGLSHHELQHAEREFLEVQRRRVAAAAGFHRLVLEIERLLGAPLDGPAAPADGPHAAGTP